MAGDRSLVLTLLTILACFASTARSAPPVRLELVTEAGFPLGGERRWLMTLQKVDFQTIRIRAARADDVAKVVKEGSDNRPSYYVIGILRADNRLVLPGARPFALGESGSIARWLEKLQAGGEEELTARRGAFGMTDKQLVATHENLAMAVNFATKGQPSSRIVQRISALLPLKVQLGSDVQAVLASEEPVRDELRGISSGTALAAVLRPLGLVLVPRAGAAGEVWLEIVDSRQASESWPVGWPSDKPSRELMPQLFKFLPVEIQDFSLEEALAAVGQRLDAPLLFDHNSMARQQIDPGQVKVNLPKSTTYYKRILDRLLFQAKLKSEIRVDEAGEPFLWVSTIKN